MKLDYCVLTSVTRDDLPDQGADHVGRTIEAIRGKLPDCKLEMLIRFPRRTRLYRARRQNPPRRTRAQHGNRPAPVQTSPPRRRVRTFLARPGDGEGISQ